jgi:peptide/nickel transport system substrate-binding protein
MAEKDKRRLSRRQFITAAGGVTAASILAACVPAAPATQPPAPAQASAPTQAPAPTQAISATQAISTTQAPAVVKAAPKGKIVYGNAEPPTSAQWDDQTVFGLVDFQVAHLVQDRLMEFDENTKIVPRLATDWTWVDASTLQLNLRKDVKFHNGDPLTSADVKATIDRVSSDSKVAHNAFWAPVKVDVQGDYQVKITANPPFGPLLNVLALTSIYPKKMVDSPDLFKTQNIGAGPYRFVDYKNNIVTLEANEGYWDGAPAVKNIMFQYIEDWNARTNAELAGDVDIITRCSAEQLDAVKGNAKFTVYDQNSPAIGVVQIWQHNNKVVANKQVRQAMYYAIDRKTILDKIMRGLGKLGYSVLPTGTLYYQDLDQHYDFSPDKAKQLLDQSGLKNIQLKMSTSTLVPHQKEIDQAIAQYLNDVGIQVSIDSLEVGQFRTTYPQYDLSLNTFGTPGVDPDFILGVYGGPVGESVFHLQDNPEIKPFEAMNKNQRSQTDAAKRQAGVLECSKWLWDFAPTLELSDEIWPCVVNARVQNFKRNRTFGEALVRYATLKE